MDSAASCPAYDPDSAKILCGEKTRPILPTSTVSRCRATGTYDGITASSWACRDRRPPGLPVLTLIPPLSVGTLWGQLWGHDLGAAGRVEPQVGRVTARRGHGVLTWVFGWPVVAVVDRWLRGHRACWWLRQRPGDFCDLAGPGWGSSTETLVALTAAITSMPGSRPSSSVASRLSRTRIGREDDQPLRLAPLGGHVRTPRWPMASS
jgi:hypothetical protein